MGGLRFRMLGPLEVTEGSRRAALGGPKQRVLLAALLINANTPVSVDRLFELLWADAPPARATAALQVCVGKLRRALEPLRPRRGLSDVLITQPRGYMLRVAPGDVDAACFERLANLGRELLFEGQFQEAHRTLDYALSLWRGPVLEDLAQSAFAQPESARLEELRALALEHRAKADVALGRHAEIMPELKVLVRERPLHEGLWYLLVLCFYRSGRQAEALRSLAQARRILKDELGVEPGPVLRRLEADILAQSPTIEFAPSVTAEPPPVLPDRHGRPVSRLRHRALVGREEELDVLETALAQACKGRGQTAFVIGEPGIGKTRLVEELADRAARAGAVVVWGRATEGEEAPALSLWAQVVRALLEVVGPEALIDGAEIVQIVPEIRDLVPDLPDLPASCFLDTAGARFRLYESVSRLVRWAAVFGPVVVILDDLQWADSPSLQLTRHVAGGLGETAMLLLGTYRDDEVSHRHPVTEALGALARHPGFEQVSLRGLTPAAVGQFIAQTTGVDPDLAMVAAVHARTEGNPFFVAELARAAADVGMDKGRASRSPVPPRVRDVILRRLARLPETTNRLLVAGAVSGGEFDLRVVASATGLDEDAALEAVEAALINGLVIEDTALPTSYRFSHTLVVETLRGESALLR